MLPLGLIQVHPLQIEVDDVAKYGPIDLYLDAAVLRVHRPWVEVR